MYIYKFIKNWWENKKYQKILNKAYKDDHLIAKMSGIMGAQFYKDWIGRLYAIINPAIRDGQYSSEQAYEYVQGINEGYDATEYTKAWILQRLSLTERFIRENDLFDILAYKIQPVDANSNYLLMLYPWTLPDTIRYAKRAAIELLILFGIGTTALLLF